MSNIRDKVELVINNTWQPTGTLNHLTLIRHVYGKSRRTGKGSANWNGELFEALVIKMLISSEILAENLFAQRSLALVPHTKFDIILCASNIKTGVKTPICLSMKTSLRERYKQAEMESVIAKQVHRGCVTALLTLDTAAVQRVKNKLYGIDLLIDCNEPRQLDQLLKLIHSKGKLVTRNELPIIGPLISETAKETALRIRQEKRI